MDQFEGLLNFIRVIFCTWITRMKYAVSTQNRWLDSDWYKILIPVKSLKSLELILGPTSIESGNQTKKYEWVWTRKLSLAKMMFPLLSWSGFSLSATWIIFYFHAMMQRFYVNSESMHKQNCCVCNSAHIITLMNNDISICCLQNPINLYFSPQNLIGYFGNQLLPTQPTILQ